MVNQPVAATGREEGEKKRTEGEKQKAKSEGRKNVTDNEEKLEQMMEDYLAASIEGERNMGNFSSDILTCDNGEANGAYLQSSKLYLLNPIIIVICLTGKL